MMLFLTKVARFFALFLSPLTTPRRLKLVSDSGLFDEDYYLANTPKLNWIYTKMPMRHYLLVGERIGLKPNPWFSPHHYRLQYSDTPDALRSPLLHFIATGQDRTALRSGVEDDVPLPVVPVHPPRARVAVVVHIFFPEVWEEMSRKLQGANLEFDLFVTLTCPNGKSAVLAERFRSDWPDAVVLSFPNRGRDIFPFWHLLQSGVLDGYEAVCKLHGKRSLHLRNGDDWRRLQVSSLFPDTVAEELAFFLTHPATGLWAPRDSLIQGADNWGENRERTLDLLEKQDVPAEPDALIFPAGSAYWLSTAGVSALKDLRLDFDDFEPETGQLDGTLAHCVERSIGYVLSHRKLHMTDRPREASAQSPVGTLLISSRKAEITSKLQALRGQFRSKNAGS